MNRIDLPAGAWAELRDVDTVTERQRKPLIAAMDQMKTPDEAGLGALFNVQDALILILVESWSFPAPLTADGLLDLPAKAVDEMRKVCQESMKGLLPDFEPTPDPTSPTAPSSD